MKALIIFALSLLCTGESQITKSDISGLYVNEDCKMTIEITNHRAKHQYHLITDDRNEKGDLQIEFDNDEGGLIIELTNSKAVQPRDPNREENIFFYLSNDTITIQNYGNSINEYQQLNCDEKYIIFAKDRSHH